MSDLIWPIDLPQAVAQDGYQETRVPNTIRSPVDQGRPKARRRYTASIQSFNIRLLLTEDQADLLDDFYEDTTAAGSLEFDWVHPRTQAAAVCQFSGDPPVTTAAGGLMYNVAFTMIILP
jgi:hypothetical protein